MKLRDLVRFCHPVLIGNDDEKYWIGQNGTCFIASRADRMFIITARHCVAPASVSNLLICFHEGKFLPLIAGYQRTAERTVKEDSEDLYIAEVNRKAMDAEHATRPPCVEMNDDPPTGLLSVSVEPELCIPGYPKDRADIDYDGRVLHPKPTILSAWYLSPDVENECHRIRFWIGEPNVVGSLDGFSGSPVFWVPKVGPGRRWALVGMLIRGNTQWGSFMNASVIVRGLDAIIDANPAE